jgi:urea transport system substrate-binding protein
VIPMNNIFPLFRRSWRPYSFRANVLLTVLLLVVQFSTANASAAGNVEPIRIGILHSLSGTMAISETPLVNSALLAVDEINAAGGIQGRPLDAIIVDTRSDWDYAASEAERLLTEENVVSLFGCWTSACRKAVLPVVQQHRGLLWYPVQYEGQESSPYVIYTGAAPNQQIIPAVDWAMNKFGEHVFLVGSDYVFPHTANLIIREMVSARGGEIVGEEYLPLGSTDVQQVVAHIVSTQPDIILNTINGDTNVYFFFELGQASSAQKIPTLSFSIAENEIRTIGTHLLQDNYVAWNYFQSLESEENSEFVNTYRKQFGQNAVSSDPIEAAYFQILAFAEAASDASELTPMAIRDAALGFSMDTPGGYIRIDKNTQHTWKTVRIGLIQSDGQIKSVMESVVPIEPDPFANGQDPAPTLYPIDAQTTLTSQKAFTAALDDSSRTAMVAMTLRQFCTMPWTASEKLDALMAAVSSPNFIVRYEAVSAVECLDASHVEIITSLLNSEDSFDLVNGLHLLSLEESPNASLANRAVTLLGHVSRRVRLAAGNALLSQAQHGWTADAEATSQIIAGNNDSDLGVQGNALKLSAFSTQFTTRLLPVLADVDFVEKPDFFRGELCLAASQTIVRNAVTSAEEGRDQAISAFEQAAMHIEQAGCLSSSQMNDLYLAIGRAKDAAGNSFLNWLGGLFSANVGLGLVVSLVLIVLLFEILALLLSLIVLAVSPASLIDILRNLSHTNSVRLRLWKVEFNLFDALTPSWFKNSRRALRAWTQIRLDAYRDAFARTGTVQMRQKHVTLPAIFPGKIDAIEPSPEEVRRLVQGGQLKLHIVGEGGTGKTSLACLIGRWAMSNDSNERLGLSSRRGREREGVIAVMLEPGEPLVPTVDGFLAALQRKLSINGQSIPMWMIKNLIYHKLVFVIIDDVFEIDGITPDVLTSPELNGLWLIATSRIELPAGMGDWCVIRPQKLRGRILTEFFVNYAKISGYADKVGDDDIETYVTQFKQLLGASESRQETVVYFACLFLDYALEQQAQLGSEYDVDLGRRRPRSVPELVENFVDNTCRHAAMRNKLNRVEVVGLVRKAAYMAIVECYRPGLLALSDLVKESARLKEELGIPSVVDIEKVLLDSGLIERPTAYHLRFKIDLVHEYCAVLDMRDRAAACTTHQQSYGLWKKWIDNIRVADPQPQTSGLLKAIYECLRSDRVAAEVPGNLLSSVADLLGIERLDLQPIRIGILHSLQGTMAMSEIALRDAALLAVDEINEVGGIAGRRLEAIVRDGASDPAIFADQARRLILDDGVISIFGCWTSASRKRVKPVVEAEHSLLWYPVQYEGYEASEAIIYTGAAPNQQIIPAVEWSLRSLLPSLSVDIRQAHIYLIGSDYVFPRRANAIIRRRLQEDGILPVAEKYIPLGMLDFSNIVEDIQKVGAHVVINTVNGSSNIGFFRALEERGIQAKDCPVISLSVAEAEIRDIGARRLAGHYAVWNYFQSLPGQANEKFVRAFQQKYGTGRVTSDPIATAYSQVKLFAEAARRTRVPTREDLCKQLELVEIDTPVGKLKYDPRNRHYYKYVYVGKVTQEGQFQVVESWENGRLVAPEPFPYPDLYDVFRSEEE